MFFYYNCRIIGHLSSWCSYEISNERDSYTSSSSGEGSTLIEIEDLDSTEEDNECTSSREEDKYLICL